MTKIKICGIRNDQDIEIINTYKPDFAGFILAESKREVQISDLKSLIKNLDNAVRAVGVFVNSSIGNVIQAIDVGLSIIQLHGEETEDYIYKLKDAIKDNRILIWKAVRVSDTESLEDFELMQYKCVDGILLDKYSPKEYGGTGETFNWHLFSNHSITEKPLILAGGLNEENVKEAINVLKPYCIDVSSGVETDGKKDENKVKNFINKVKL